MLIITAILLLVITPLAMLIIRLVWPRFAYHWLVAASGALAAWPVVMVASQQLPQAIPLVAFQPGSLFPSWPVLLVDRLSWPFALSLSTLVLAVILTEIGRAPEADWAAWAGSLILAALGILAVLAGNPLTLLLAWTAIDLFELLILLVQVKPSALRERVVIAFSARVLGSVLLTAAAMVARSEGQVLTFAIMPAQSGVFLLLAAGLRLGVLPLHLPFLQDLPLRRGMGTMVRLAPPAAALVLLARTATAGGETLMSPILLGLTGLAALYGSAAWVFARNELEGRPLWILGGCALAVAAAIRGQPAASLAWGLAVLFSGGLLFLSSARDRGLTWLTLAGLLGISTLPYSPAWSGLHIYAQPSHLILIVFLLSHVLLVLGYIRHTLRPGAHLADMERWVWLIYPLGLAVLPTTHFFLGLWSNQGMETVPVLGWVTGLIVTGLAIWFAILVRRMPANLTSALAAVSAFFSMDWLYQLFWRFYRSSGRVVGFVTAVMEGEGGVLWALLIIVMLFSVLVRNGN